MLHVCFSLSLCACGNLYIQLCLLVCMCLQFCISSDWVLVKASSPKYTFLPLIVHTFCLNLCSWTHVFIRLYNHCWFDLLCLPLLIFGPLCMCMCVWLCGCEWLFVWLYLLFYILLHSCVFVSLHLWLIFSVCLLLYFCKTMYMCMCLVFMFDHFSDYVVFNMY